MYCSEKYIVELGFGLSLAKMLTCFQIIEVSEYWEVKLCMGHVYCIGCMCMGLMSDTMKMSRKGTNWLISLIPIQQNQPFIKTVLIFDQF